MAIVTITIEWLGPSFARGWVAIVGKPDEHAKQEASDREQAGVFNFLHEIDGLILLGNTIQ